MNLDLKNKEWKEFVFEQIFDIDSTSSGIDRNKLINKKGLIPYLTRSEKDNGYDSFICEQADKYKIDDANVITVGLDTQTVFYQPNKFYTGQNIQVLKSEQLNKNIAKFLIPLIKKQMEKFNWGGNGATLTRLRRSKLFLPINTKGEPDFEFMETFMKQKEQEKFQEYNDYISNRIKDLKDFKTVEPIEEKEFGEFEILALFDTKIGKSIDGNKVNKSKGNAAYVTRKETNNGIDGFINYDKSYLNKSFPVITIGNETAEPFVQKYSFFTGTKVNVLKSKKVVSYLVLSFIATSLRQHKRKYSYSFTINSTRLKKQKILLPVNDQKEPDYDYMENYMKQLEYKKLNEYLSIKQ
jgi:hypothetical protein